MSGISSGNHRQDIFDFPWLYDDIIDTYDLTDVLNRVEEF
nr:MAG TPA: hypothetical protein [Caudoviricetes sp.]